MIDVHAYFRLQTGQVTKQMINEPYLASSPKGGTYGSLCTWNVSDGYGYASVDPTCIFTHSEGQSGTTP